VSRFGPLRVLAAGMAVAAVGLLLFGSVGAHTTFFPTIFFACFAIGLGIGTAFMPLLTIAMADVPPADAGLGSGITNVSQQLSGALGLAVLSTVATNHTKALLAAHHGVVSSLIGGYHVAFIAGAATTATGIALALALLRPRGPGPDLQLAEDRGAPVLDLDMEQQAA
jgi:MFS family permease